jgi:hypothetical protein
MADNFVTKDFILSQPMKCGLLFIERKDPLSDIVGAISGFSFSNIGLYYQTGLPEDKIIRVLIMDMVTGLTLPSVSTPGMVLEDLLADPLVKRVAARPFMRPLATDFYNESLIRLAIANTIAEGKEISLKEWWFQLVGHPIEGETKGLTSVEMVAKIMRALETVTPKAIVTPQIIVDTSAIAERTPLEVESGAAGRGQLISTLVKPISMVDSESSNAANTPLSSFLLPQRMLQPIVFLKVASGASPIAMELSHAEANDTYRDYVKNILNQFVDLILTDQPFFETVRKGVNQTLMLQKLSRDALVDEIHRGNDVMLNLLQFIKSSIESRSMDIEDVADRFDEVTGSLFSSSVILGEPEPTPLTPPTIPNTVAVEVTKDSTVGVFQVLTAITDKLGQVAVKLRDENKIDLNYLIYLVNTMNNQLRPGDVFDFIAEPLVVPTPVGTADVYYNGVGSDEDPIFYAEVNPEFATRSVKKGGDEGLEDLTREQLLELRTVVMRRGAELNKDQIDEIVAKIDERL